MPGRDLTRGINRDPGDFRGETGARFGSAERCVRTRERGGGRKGKQKREKAKEERQNEQTGTSGALIADIGKINGQKSGE